MTHRMLANSGLFGSVLVAGMSQQPHKVGMDGGSTYPCP